MLTSLTAKGDPGAEALILVALWGEVVALLLWETGRAQR